MIIIIGYFILLQPHTLVRENSCISGHTTYRITVRDLSILGPSASEPEDQAKQSKMPYTTLIEVLSERFHTTQQYLRSLNSWVVG